MSTVEIIRRTPVLQALPIVKAETDQGVLADLVLTDPRARIREAAFLRYSAQAGGSGGGGDTIYDIGGPFTLMFTAASVARVHTNQPDAVTELFAVANMRTEFDLTGRTLIQAFCAGTVPGGAGSKLLIQYTLDLSGATGWTDMSPTACSVLCDGMLATNSPQIGTEVAIPVAARTRVLLSVFSDGDATATDDPAYTVVGVVIT